jgi:hypothetical protein
MKITLTQLRSIIKEAIKLQLTDEESVVPGKPFYDDPTVSPEDASKIGDGIWFEEKLEEDIDE